MRALVPALICEGPTDRRFLEPLLTRILQRELRVGPEIVEIYRFIDPRAETRAIGSIIAALQASLRSFDLLFVHADGKGQAARVERERVEPIAVAVAPTRPTIPVVPVHETEAWLLADCDALRQALRTTRTDRQLGPPQHVDEIERLTDPKQRLRTVMEQTVPQRRRRSAVPPFQLLGELVALDKLERLPAARMVRERTGAALVELRLLP